MQHEIRIQVDFGKNVSAYENIGHVPSIDKTTSDFDKGNLKVPKLKRLVDCGEYDADVA